MNYSILELSQKISLILYILSDIINIRKGYSGNMARNPNFDMLFAQLATYIKFQHDFRQVSNSIKLLV